MPVTEKDDIFYPDLDEVDQPNVWAATMAQSISDGIGARLQQQEVAVGLKAGIDPATGIPTQSAIAPFVVRSANAGFNAGFALAGGIATVKTKGLYLIASSVGLDPSFRSAVNAGRTISITLYKNTVELAGSEVIGHDAYYQNSAATTVISCEPGDTLYVKWYSASTAGNSAPPAKLAASSVLNYLSIALVQALPA